MHASRAAFEAAGIGPEDVGVIQLQDTDAGAEIIHMAENGFCADGDQERLIADGATEIGGPMPINTDGGLIANGEPLGASGLRVGSEVVGPSAVVEERTYLVDEFHWSHVRTLVLVG